MVAGGMGVGAGCAGGLVLPGVAGGVEVAVGSVTTGRAVTRGVDWGAGGRVTGIGAVLPAETVSCRAGEAKECQAKLMSEVTGIGVWIVNRYPI